MDLRQGKHAAVYKSFDLALWKRLTSCWPLQGDINYWVPVLDHFDSFFEECISNRADVQLKSGEADVAADPPFPTDSCLAVLNATCVLLDNCSNKAAYNSSEVGDQLKQPSSMQCMTMVHHSTHQSCTIEQHYSMCC
jgi:hypothetical protein